MAPRTKIPAQMVVLAYAVLALLLLLLLILALIVAHPQHHHAAAAAAAVTAATAPSQAAWRSTPAPPILADSLVSKGARCDPDVPSISGRLRLGDGSGDAYFFWFFERRGETAWPDMTPVTLWLTGGPGCSSTFALLAENGPCHVSPDGSGLTYNPYSWTNHSHMLWLDQPAGVGFSLEGDAPNGTASSLGGITSEGAARKVVDFLARFVEAYPQYSGPRPFFIFGESYGGHYVPAVARRWLRQTTTVAQEETMAALRGWRLEGIGLGNGFTAPAVQYASEPEMAWLNTYAVPLVSSEGAYQHMAAVSAPACQEWIAACHMSVTAAPASTSSTPIPFSISTSTSGTAIEVPISTAPGQGIQVPVTAAPISQMPTAGVGDSCRKAVAYCGRTLDDAACEMGRNPYDIRHPCLGGFACYGSRFDPLTTFMNLPSTLSHLLGSAETSSPSGTPSASGSSPFSPSPSPAPPAFPPGALPNPYGSRMELTPSVMAACKASNNRGVRGSGPLWEWELAAVPPTRKDIPTSDGSGPQWQVCSAAVGERFAATDVLRSFAGDVAHLLDERVRVLVYAGDADYLCNWMGNKAWTLELGWRGAEEYSNLASDTEWTPLEGDPAVSGEIRSAQGLTFLRVFNAGHMVPMDQPLLAQLMFEQFVTQITLKTNTTLRNPRPPLSFLISARPAFCSPNSWFWVS